MLVLEDGEGFSLWRGRRVDRRAIFGDCGFGKVMGEVVYPSVVSCRDGGIQSLEGSGSIKTQGK